MTAEHTEKLCLVKQFFHNTVHILIKLNTTVTFQLLAIPALLTASHYKVLPIHLKYCSIKNQLTYIKVVLARSWVMILVFSFTIECTVFNVIGGDVFLMHFFSHILM
jgi:hypothetical protein